MYDAVQLGEKEKYWIGEIFGIYHCRKSDEFISVLQRCAKLQGNGIEDFGAFSFASQFEKDYVDYFGDTGVCFDIDAYIANEKEDLEIIVSNEEFYKILEEECERFYKKFPNKRQEVEALLLQTKEKLLG